VTLDERVALKFLLPEFATQEEAAPRFLREARAAVKIKSEHVARVSDVGTLETGAPYMVMEFLEGQDLSDKLVAEGLLGVEDAVDYVIQGCDALAEAHGYGIVHRDIKPANLFLTRRPNGTPLVKLLDFGISKTMAQVDNLTKTTAALGSALYMSPEQMQQTRGVDSRTDIYALGITLYELLAGKQPFYAETLPALCAEIFTGTPTPLRTIRPDVPEGLAAVLEKAYARDRGARHQSVGELVLALAPYAPRRSQATIEGIAKMSGLDAPVGAPSSAISSSPLAATVNDTATSPALARQSGTQFVPASQPVPTSQVPASMTGDIVRQSTAPGMSVGAAAPAPHASSRGAFTAVASVLALLAAAIGTYVATHRPAPQIAGVVETAVRVAPGVPANTTTAPAPEVGAPSALPSSAPGAAPTASATVAPKGSRYVRPQPVVQPLPPVPVSPPPPPKRDIPGF
jgi:serine/threonine-protein kinase